MGGAAKQSRNAQASTEMALTDALTFARNITEVSAAEKAIQTISLSIKDGVVVKARLRLNGRFIDVFYNAKTGTCAFALIEKGRRIFGADNTGGWHIHPKEAPDSHKASEQVKFKQFLKEALKVRSP